MIDCCRLVFGLFAALLVWVTPSLVQNGEVPVYYFVILISLYVVHQVTMHVIDRLITRKKLYIDKKNLSD